MITFSEKIKNWRVQKKLSQESVADQLGISRPSFVAVENGSKELTLSQVRRLALALEVPLEELIFDHAQVATSDYNYEKYKQIVLNCLKFGGAETDGKIPKTKLAKLAYLADFAWFYQTLEPMSGLAYRRIHLGPVPDQYFRVLDDLYDSEAINIVPSGKAVMIEALEQPPTDKLSKEELGLIKSIAKKWRNSTTQEIVEYTHEQLPWKLCRPGELIPYELITQEDPGNVF